MNVDIDDISFFIKKIIDGMKEKGIENIEIDKDFYWNIPMDEIYNPYEQPKNLDLGQLSDDINELTAAKLKDSFCGYNLKHLSSILRYIADQYPA